MGFDVSPALFPPPQALPTQVTLHEHDIRHPFAVEVLGTFDVVHARFLKYAFLKTEWEGVLQNMVSLLSLSSTLCNEVDTYHLTSIEPGGYLLWEDSDYSLYSCLPSSLAFTEMVNFDIEFALKSGRDIR